MKLARNGYRKLRRFGGAVLRNLEMRRGRRTLCNSADLLDTEKNLVRRVSLKVHRDDSMYIGKTAAFSYLEAGLSASRCIQASLRAAAQTTPVMAILDFPCGYGRVLRYLKQTFPDSAITGGEITVAALDFCQRAFSIQTFHSTTDFGSLAVPRKFDLIWCGSLITHVDEQATLGLLGFFYRHLLDGGVCIFTTGGQHVADMIESKELQYDLTAEGQERLLRDYRQKGYGYADYVGSSGLGISLTSQSRVLQLAQGVGSWKLAHYIENGWHGLQDVYAFKR